MPLEKNTSYFVSYVYY